MNHGYPEHSWFDPRLEKRESPIHGSGVYATAPIKAGELLQRVGGIVFTSAEQASVQARIDPARAYNEGKLDDDLFIVEPIDDGFNYFFNPSCDPNFWGDTARRDIAAGEEITMDYAVEFDDPDYLLEPCRCGTALCRGRLTGQDWRRPDLQERYRGHFIPFLERRIEALRDSR
ncbi:MAG TPA: SET domain-containing protein-lysine N-methyltransferase [Herpetosiphonaceae bacterium]|nr:SET domain-containing protein-lysine N-methyltransferase [Herpetosiphonaceae bacterium]